jgi:hypothetical protein
MGALLGVVAFTVAVVLAVRAMQRRAVERAQPGHTAARPIAITDYGEMDLSIRLLTCGCGGHYLTHGEGPAAGGLRVAHLECRRCGRERAVYFDVRGVLH